MDGSRDQEGNMGSILCLMVRQSPTAVSSGARVSLISQCLVRS